MRQKLIFALLPVLVAITAASAKQQSYETGKVIAMDSKPCGTAEKSSKTVAGEILGTDADNRTTQQVLCPEYAIQAQHILYHVRPEDTKHPAILPVGETAMFRMNKGKMMLRMQESDDSKEHSYTVVSMTPQDADQAIAVNGTK